MLSLLWLIPALPLAGFLVLLFGGRRLGRATGPIGVGSVCLSMVLSLILALSLFRTPPFDLTHTQLLFTWFDAAGLAPVLSLRLDTLSCVMVLVITIVGFLIHLYSANYMVEEEGYARFFAYMNLFVASMLILVLADDLLFLYLGWEGVGLCSYLLIGFWYREPANGRAALKAFLVTRIGDTALAVAIVVLFVNLGTLQMQDLMKKAVETWPEGSTMVSLVAALLLAGAVGKSAQFPLHTWLPDAMAGPVPASALIHAATMVTAGVYLIARMHILFAHAPEVQLVVALIGVATLLIGAGSALVQRDLKRILAYSTMSQVGYMFLALGVGAWSAAVFHFATHAFFKALLFLAAGLMIKATHGEQDIYRMRGLRKSTPAAFWGFMIGAASLSAFPFITAGFYSKEAVLLGAWSSARWGTWLWTAGLAGAFLTALYAFRPLFVAFFGPGTARQSYSFSRRETIPLVMLSLFSLAAGFADVPGLNGGGRFLSNFLGSSFSYDRPEISSSVLSILLTSASVVSLGALFLVWLLYSFRPHLRSRLTSIFSVQQLRSFFMSGWGFDSIYQKVVARPFIRLALANRDDLFDQPYRIASFLIERASRVMVMSQTGRLRWYGMGIGIGVAAYIGIAVFF
jgi:NADH-quinone oxidoreductase subunit L